MKLPVRCEVTRHVSRCPPVTAKALIFGQQRNEASAWASSSGASSAWWCPE
jgi:hypothetical protein